MTLVLIILIALVCVIHGRVIARNGGLAQCRPAAVLACVNLVRVVPMCIASVFSTEFIDPRVLSFVGPSRFHGILLEYLLIEIVGSAIFFSIIKSLEWHPRATSFDLSLRTATCFASAGMALLTINIYFAGGLAAYLSEFHKRLIVFGKVKAVYIPAYLLHSTSIAIAMRQYVEKRKAKDLIAFLILLLLGLIVAGYSGGRKDGLMLVVLAVVFWAVYAKRIYVRAWWLVSIGSIFLLYMNGLAALRREGGMMDLLTQPMAFLADALLNVVQPFITISYLSTYILIIGTFARPHVEYWGPAIFASAPEALVPRVINPSKPPLDEGVYLYNLLNGWRGTPPAPMSQLLHSSMPPETIGNGYLVGGFLGAIAFCAIKGLLLCLLWKMSARMHAPFSIICTCYIAYTVEVSPYRIVQVGLLFVQCQLLNTLFLAVGVPVKSAVSKTRQINLKPKETQECGLRSSS